jgi:hypothetical protein
MWKNLGHRLHAYSLKTIVSGLAVYTVLSTTKRLAKRRVKLSRGGYPMSRVNGSVITVM